MQKYTKSLDKFMKTIDMMGDTRTVLYSDLKMSNWGRRGQSWMEWSAVCQDCPRVLARRPPSPHSRPNSV